MSIFISQTCLLLRQIRIINALDHDQFVFDKL